MSKTIDFSTQLVIGGRPVPGVEGKTFDTINPANGKVLASIAEANSDDVNNAVSAARKAFEQGPWSKMAPADRKKNFIAICYCCRSSFRRTCHDGGDGSRQAYH